VGSLGFFWSMLELQWSSCDEAVQPGVMEFSKLLSGIVIRAMPLRLGQLAAV
jgi:hypothetical protein